MKLLLVRHGETHANLANRWSGSKDLDITNLTDSGREQAIKLGRWFKERRFTPTHVYSSPQQRAKDTCELAGGHWGLQEEARRERGAKVLRVIIANHTNDDTIVMFAHAGIIQQIVCAILESPRLWGLAAKNTALYEFSIDVDNWYETSRTLFNPTAWRIIRFNEQPHL